MEDTAVSFALAAAAALLAVTAYTRIRTGWRSWQIRQRGLRARRAESDAERVLKRRGYRVVSRQVRGAWSYPVDGTRLRVEVCADLVVSRRGRILIAEVKTGPGARPRQRDTRRQLLEYHHAFPKADGLLLVDPEGDRVMHIAFPNPTLRRGRIASTGIALALGGFALGYAVHGKPMLDPIAAVLRLIAIAQ